MIHLRKFELIAKLYFRSSSENYDSMVKVTSIILLSADQLNNNYG